jgi:type I restriction enzyme, S subunit
MSQVRRLGELVADVRPGFAHGGRSPDGLAQVRMNNVTTRGTWDWSRIVRLPVSQDDFSKYLLEPGDILFNNTNSTELVGKTAHFEGFVEPIVFSNHFTRVRTTPELDSLYLAQWLLAQWHSGLFARICDRWIGQSAVRIERLFDMPIELPPLAEQRRIAGWVTRTLSVAEGASELLVSQQESSDRLADSYVASVLVRAGERWPQVSLGELVSTRPSPSTTSEGDTEIVAVTTACLTPTGFDPGGLRPKRMPRAAAAFGGIQAGEVLVARSNTPNLVGRAALYEGKPAGIVATDLIFRLVPDRDRLYGEYLARYLSGLQLSGFWRRRAAGASSTMSKITRRQLSLLPIALPPKAVQIEIVDGLRRTLGEIGCLAIALDAQLQAAKAIPVTVLQNIFGPS